MAPDDLTRSRHRVALPGVDLELGEQAEQHELEPAEGQHDGGDQQRPAADGRPETFSTNR